MPLNRKNLLFLGLLFLVLWFFNIGQNKLIEPDEGRYAEIPREMIATNDFVTPRLNGVFYFEKPPLQYWMTAASLKVFGNHTWAARLPTAMTGALTVIAVFAFGFFDGAITLGFLAAILLMCSPFQIIMGHINTLDTALSFFVTVLMLALCFLIRPNLSAKQKKYANLFLWTSAALGLLTKGLLVLAVPGLAVIIYCLCKRSLQVFKNINWVWGPILFLILTVPWFVIVCQRNPDFFRFFFIHEHFDRFLKNDHDRLGPPWYFVPILIVGFFPTLVFFVRKNLKSIFSSVEDKNLKDTNLLLLIWSLTFFIFFSISKSKLPPYILPIFPSLAILMAQIIMHLKDRSLVWMRAGFGLFITMSLGAAAHFWGFSDRYRSVEIYKEFCQWLIIASIIFIALLIIEKFILRKKDYVFRVGYICFSALLFLQVIFWGYAAFSPTNSGYKIAQAIKPFLTPETPIYSVTQYVQSVPFYLERTVILVETKGELEYGIEHTPNRQYVKDVRDFIDEWNAIPQAVAISSKYTYLQSLKDHIEHQVIFEDERRVAFIKKPSQK